MSKNRIKAAGPSIRTREEMEAAVATIADLKIAQQHFTAQLNERVAAVQAEFAGQLDSIEAQIKAGMDSAMAWAEANPLEFGDRKSIEMTRATVGWRIGQPALKTIPGWTFDRVLERLQAIRLEPYVRILHEVDKQAIIADRANLSEAELRSLGLRVVQAETFFLEPKITEVESRESVKV